MDENCIIILSGGLDSTVLVYHVLDKGLHPLLLTFDYGQKHTKEIVMAKRTAEVLNLRHLVVRLPLNDIFKYSSLLKGGSDIPEGRYTNESQRSTVVPNRNMILLAVAAGVAEDRGISKVYYGAHSNDRAIYPDCRPEFIDAVSEATKKGTYNNVEIIAPFKERTKAEVVKEGVRLDVPFKNTWSCYKGGETPCGKCGTCVERKEAFKLAGAKDPGD
ncbi:MAG: 7-cyano-7-deazaguanine synthase QueC [Candidatus Methanofastidiosia archaeon]